MSFIHILDEVTSNQIAAGEVVERPVNAVKELVENSIDAGAHEIEVEIADGGMSYIRVTDDGSGMSPEDVKLSVIRHATSKISSVENIYHISSLGFRGEALPSIMSVSRSTITTRRAEDINGTAIDVVGGEVHEPKSVGAPEGTTVEVRELFYNVPARKKFLKSERTESSRINSMVGKIALANPDIAFRLINNGRVVIETPGNGRLADVISSLYGIKTTGEMLEVEGERDDVSVSGLISKPSLLKSNRQYQTLIINRRVVESPIITKAADNAYHSLLPKNGYPIMVLSLTLPPEGLDVNVHPQKREIKFDDEQKIFRLVYHSILQTLTTQTAPDSIVKEMIKNPGHSQMVENSSLSQITIEDQSPGKNDIGLYHSDFKNSEQTGKQSWREVPDSYKASSTNLFKESDKKQQSISKDRTQGKSFEPGLETAEILSKQTVFINETETIPEKEDLLFEKQSEDVIPVIPLGQIADCFILCQHGKDLFIIDQHAAHERIRYDRLAAKAEGIPVQAILIPYLIHVDPADLDLLIEKTEEVKRIGITFEQAGPDVIRITGAPEDFLESEMEQVIKDILIAFHESDVPSPATMRHRMMAYAACRGAIKRGDPLNVRQMKELISDLFHTTRPFVCPHGRPTIVKFTPEELGRLFDRT